MKKLCISTIILAFIIVSSFSLTQLSDEKTATMTVPMGINMQISSGVMHDRVILLATSEEEEERSTRNRDYDNKVVIVGKVITFTGIGAIVLGLGLLVIAPPAYFLISFTAGDIPNPDVITGLIVSSVISGLVGVILIPPGGITWLVGRAIQNSRDKKQARQAQDEINVSYNTFSQNFQSIINIPR